MIFEINESGGAHQKYTELLRKKADNYMKESKKKDKLVNVAKKLHLDNKAEELSKQSDDYYDKGYDYNIEARKYDTKRISPYVRDEKDAQKTSSTYIDYTDKAIKRKENFKYKFHSKGEDRLANKKPGQILAVQKELNKLKEACEIILSNIDE